MTRGAGASVQNAIQGIQCPLDKLQGEKELTGREGLQCEAQS